VGAHIGGTRHLASVTVDELVPESTDPSAREPHGASTVDAQKPHAGSYSHAAPRPFLRTFGAPALVGSPAGSAAPFRKKDLALLIFLCVEHASTHSRGRLAALLWGDGQEEKARHSLTQALGRLRPHLPERAFALRGNTLEWNDALECDARLLKAAAAGERAIDRQLSFYSGDFLADFGAGPGGQDFELWADAQRAQLRLTAILLLERWGAEAEARGQWDEARRLGLRATEIEPLYEEGHRRVIRAWSAQGERLLALRHFRTFADWLAREMGARPDPETRRLAARVRMTPGPGAPPDAEGPAYPA
jgi:DNA-binding SARP family transcriptional activator